MSRPRRASVAFVLLTLVLDTLGIGLIIPVLPRLLQELHGGDMAAASRSYGVMIAAYAAMQFVFSPIIGGLSDRYGRRPVILASLLGAALDYVLLALAPSVEWLIVGRVVSGITGANFSAVTAYIADVTPPEERAQRFGLVGAAFGVGFILGPLIGGGLGGMHTRLPFVAAAALNALNLLYGVFVLPESLPAENRRGFSLARSNPLSSLRQLARHRVVIGLTGTFVATFMAQQIVQAVWAIYTQDRYGWGPFDIGVSLSCVGISSAVVQGGLIHWIMPRLGARRTLILGLSMNAVGFAAVGLATHGWMVYALMVPTALGGLAGPATQGLISAEVGPSEQGELQGSLGSLGSLTAILGPLIGAELLTRFGTATASPRIPGAALFAAAGFHLLGMILALRLFMRAPPRAGEPGSLDSGEQTR